MSQPTPTIKVSVIIPIYNTELYLRECLESLVAQTLRDIEIICVNDGSTDSSSKILKEYAARDERFVIIEQQNAGAGAARNNGMSAARGEYLSFLDADDLFKDTMLQKAYDQCIADNADIAIYEVSTFNDKTKAVLEAPWGLRKNMLPQTMPFSCNDMPQYIFNAFQNWTWNKLFKRDFIIKNNIAFQPLRRTNDLLFTCAALALADRITVVDQCLVYYRIGMAANSQATNYIAPLDFYEAFIALKKFLTEHELYQKLQQSFINSALNGCIYNLNSIQSSKEYEKLYNKIKTDAFAELDFEGKPKDYFYNKNHYAKLKAIKRLTLAEYLKGGHGREAHGLYGRIKQMIRGFLSKCREYGVFYAIRYSLKVIYSRIRRNRK